MHTKRTFKQNWGTLIVSVSAASLVLYAAAASPAADKVNLVSVARAADTVDSWPVLVEIDDAKPDPLLPSSIFGTSGKLRAMIQPGSSRPGIAPLQARAGTAGSTVTQVSVITPRRLSESRRGRLGSYVIGYWPRPRASRGGDVEYMPPEALIEVTPENADTKLSEHFRVRDFLTKGQQDVWPKYVAVNLKLVDKLELVLAELKATRGVNPAGVKVMSGFRTPSYNATGGDPRGRATLSRHMYGDAADIYIDNGGKGRMDDLNRDGQVNVKDAQVILAAVERVEAAHPHLVGGAGIYPATKAHGPYIHIDTRGEPSRWGRLK